MTSLWNLSSGSTILVVDVSSGLVGAALVGLKGGQDPFIVHSVQKNFSGGEEAMLKSLRHTLDNLFRYGVPNLKLAKLPLGLERSVVVLSAPWADSLHDEHELESEEEFSFGNDEIGILLAEHQRSHTLSRGDDHHVFENHLVSLAVNGYRFNGPNDGMRGHKVGAGLISSSLPKRVFERIKSEVSKIFGVKEDISVRSKPFASIKFSRHIFDDYGTRMAVNFSGLHSEAMIFEGGRLRHYRVFDCGPESVSNMISEELGIPPSMARSYARLYSQDLLDERSKREVGSVISRFEKEWQEKLRDAVGESREVFLISHPEEQMIGQSLFAGAWPKAQMKRSESSLPLLTRVVHELF